MSTAVLALSGAIGFVAGLRSLTAPAAVSWAAYAGLLNLQGSPLSFMGSTAAVAIFTVLALAELVADKLAITPSRINTGPLAGRILMGGFSGACLSVAGAAGVWPGAVAGGLGAVVGAFVGYHARRMLVRRLGVPDLAIAIPEDLIAIGLACLIVGLR